MLVNSVGNAKSVGSIVQSKKNNTTNICRKVREPNREPGTEPREPETAQKPAVGKPNRTEPLMYKISSRTGRTGGRNRMRTAGMCSVCFSQANVPFNLCPRIGFVFFWKPHKNQKYNPCALLLDLFFLTAPKKQKHNPCALLLGLFFCSPKKSKTITLVPSYWTFFLCGSTTKAKSTTLVPSYWICFFWKPTPKKNKNTTLVPSYWTCFFEASKKEKHNPCALL